MSLLWDAGIANVDIKTIVVPTVFASFDDYWQAFMAGVGPAPSYVAGLEAAQQGKLDGYSAEKETPKLTKKETLSALKITQEITVKQMEEASTKHSDAPKTKEEQREFMNDLMVKTMMVQPQLPMMLCSWSMTQKIGSARILNQP